MDALIYVGAALPLVRGAAHLFATRVVVKGFGELTADNRRIITMEWIVEGVALIATAAFVVAVTAADAGSSSADATYAVAVATLLVLATVSVFTGFRVAFLPFRPCPVMFTPSAVLIALGAWA